MSLITGQVYLLTNKSKWMLIIIIAMWYIHITVITVIKINDLMSLSKILF